MPEFGDDDYLKLREQGFSPVAPPKVGEMPAGQAQWPVPPYLTFTGLVNLSSRSWRWTYDEALRNGWQVAQSMRQDAVIMEAINARKLPTAQLSFHLEADDETDPRQMKAVEKLTRVLKQTPRLQQLWMQSLEAVYFGRSAVQLLTEWQYRNGERYMQIKDFRPIHSDKLVFRWGGDLGVRVYPGYPGKMEPTDRGMVHWFEPEEREAILVHRHEPEDADYYDLYGGGSIEGIGLRGRIFWLWYLKAQLLAQVLEYSQRFCSGVKKGYYDASNPTGKADLETAIAGMTNNSAFITPKLGDRVLFDLLIEEVGTANPSFLLSFIRDYFDFNIRRMILHQTASSETGASMGGDEVGLNQDHIGAVTRFDAINLAGSVNTDLMPMLTRYNCPDCPVPPKFIFEVDDVNASELIGYAAELRQLGGDIDLDPLYAAAGLSKGQPGGTVSSAVQPLSPVGVGQTPESVPTVGPAGPQQQQTPDTTSQPQQVSSSTSQPSPNILDA